MNMNRGQTDRGYKKPEPNTDIEIAIPLGMKRIPDSMNQYSFRYETDTGQHKLVFVSKETGISKKAG